MRGKRSCRTLMLLLWGGGRKNFSVKSRPLLADVRPGVPLQLFPRVSGNSHGQARFFHEASYRIGHAKRIFSVEEKTRFTMTKHCCDISRRSGNHRQPASECFENRDRLVVDG